MKQSVDLAIAGSGFGGSLLAMIARKLGYSVALLERGRHPRFAIGESSTPLANLLLEELAREYDLPQLLPLTKWGTWQERYAQVGCGLKRGFTFVHHEAGQPHRADAGRANQLLVAASPHDAIADTHWYRPDFDAFLVEQAQAEGACYFDETLLEAPRFDGHGVELHGVRRGELVEVQAQFLIDATGPRGFLHRHLGLLEAPMPHLPGTQALFSHFRGVGDLADLEGWPNEEPPHPPDAAAVHHVFEGGWIWALRFNNGLTSAGVAATASVAEALNFREGEAAWHRLQDRFPSVRTLFKDAKAALPFQHMSRIGFRSGQITGPRWALLPSAAGFVDPLLSTGFTLNLSGILRLGDWLRQRRETGSWELPSSYAADTEADLLAAERLVSALYQAMGRFQLFVPLSLLYFAAVSFSETARRLGRTELAPHFLLRSHGDFDAAVRRLCQRATALAALPRLEERDAAAFEQEVFEAIEPIDIAGLRDASRRNWHPVNASDLFASARKLGASSEEIAALLRRCGFEEKR